MRSLKTTWRHINRYSFIFISINAKVHKAVQTIFIIEIFLFLTANAVSNKSKPEERWLHLVHKLFMKLPDSYLKCISFK